jgi:hypothetical protein
MLDPEKAGAWLEHHFQTVTPQEFVTRVKRVSPDLAQELWGDRTVEEICADRSRPVRRAPGFFTSVRQSILRFFS